MTYPDAFGLIGIEMLYRLLSQVKYMDVLVDVLYTYDDILSVSIILKVNVPLVVEYLSMLRGSDMNSICTLSSSNVNVSVVDSFV